MGGNNEKMTTICIGFLIVVLFFGRTKIDKPTQQPKTDLEEMNLNGKVNKVIKSTFEVIDKFGKITKGNRSLFENSLLFYNKYGNKIEECWYDSDGSLAWKYTYKYDNNGNKIEYFYIEQ